MSREINSLAFYGLVLPLYRLQELCGMPSTTEEVKTYDRYTGKEDGTDKRTILPKLVLDSACLFPDHGVKVKFEVEMDGDLTEWRIIKDGLAKLTGLDVVFAVHEEKFYLGLDMSDRSSKWVAEMSCIVDQKIGQMANMLHHLIGNKRKPLMHGVTLSDGDD
jgi:hypothetical protein